MRKFLVMGALCMALSLCGCGGDSGGAQKPEEMAFAWSSRGDKPSEMLTDLTEDILVSILKESYEGKRSFGDLRFDVVNLQNTQGDLAMDFDLKASYRELTEGENPAEPLIVGKEELVMELPLRLTADAERGKIKTESVFLAVREGDAESSRESWHLLTQDLPDLEDAGTFTGTLQFPDEGNVLLNRRFWIEETHGYTENGYFLMETNTSYTLPVAEDCECSYFKDGSAAESISLEDLRRQEDLEDRLFLVTQEEGSVAYLSERYRP